MMMSRGVEKSLRFDRLNINGFAHSELKLGSRWMEVNSEFHKTFTGYMWQLCGNSHFSLARMSEEVISCRVVIAL